jgi:hypothetical protein
MTSPKPCRIIAIFTCFALVSDCVCGAAGQDGAVNDCFPFNQFDDTLDAGYWTFSLPGNLTSPDCQRHFHVEKDSGDGSPECVLRRYSAGAARECLRGKHIVMIGDSLMHYQFQSLVLFLHTGRHPRAVSRNPEPIITDDAKTPSFKFGDGCHLEGLRCDTSLFSNDSLSATANNRYYYNAEFDVNVTLLGIYEFANGRSPVGWYPPSVPFDDGWEWKKGGIPRLAAVIQQNFGKVDEIVVNVGVWGMSAMFPAQYQSQQHYMTGAVEDVVEELRTLEALSRKVHWPSCCILVELNFDLNLLDVGAPQKPIWATTTELNPATRKDGIQSAKEQKGTGLLAAKQLSWRVLDRYGIKESLLEAYSSLGKTQGYVYVDFMHFVPFINDEFNNVLLNMLCR